MALASEEQMPDLLEAILSRDEDPVRACVVERRRPPTTITTLLPTWRLCPTVGPTKPARSGALNKQSAVLSYIYGTWSSLLQRKPNDPWAWIDLAVRSADVTLEAPDSPLAEITSWMVIAAALNATLVGTKRGIVVTASKPELDRIRRGVIAPHREYLDPIVASWLTRAD